MEFKQEYEESPLLQNLSEIFETVARSKNFFEEKLEVVAKNGKAHLVLNTFEKGKVKIKINDNNMDEIRETLSECLYIPRSIEERESIIESIGLKEKQNINDNARHIQDENFEM